MPSMNERTRNNVRMGVFVTFTILLALGVVASLSNVREWLSASSHQYTVTFPVRSGVANLKKSSEVRVGGVKLGEVVRVDPRVEDPVFEKIDVVFKLRRSVRLHKNARILISSQLIGSDSWIDIVDVGSPLPDGTANRVEPGGSIDGAMRSGMLSTLIGDDNAAKTDNFFDFLGNIPDEYTQRIVPIIDDVQATTGNVRAVTTALREENWPEWSEKVSEILAWANDLQGSIESALAEGKGLMTDGRAILEENRANVRTITERGAGAATKADEILSTVQEETVHKVHEFLDNGNDGLRKAVALIERLQLDYEAWATDLGDALGNASLASHQLKLAMIEIRRSPWRLLYRPSTTELEHEMLYEAARSFAMAAADLKAASVSVERVLNNHGDALRADEEVFNRVTRSLLDPISRYEEAQRRLLDILFDGGTR
ncbi:MAG TPA: hypothetical protein PK098_03505 [Phycisphaerales bacterium]|nr:hypothetical protein [Phycisphaerales bacterium]